jgi:hypothetical protein
MQCYESGSGWGPDPRHADPDRYQVQANGKNDKLNFYQRNFKILSKILKIGTFDADEKKITNW